MNTPNPHLPRIRRDAVIFADKHGVRAATRHFGYSPEVIAAWYKKFTNTFTNVATKRAFDYHHAQFAEYVLFHLLLTQQRLPLARELPDRSIYLCAEIYRSILYTLSVPPRVVAFDQLLGQE